MADRNESTMVGINSQMAERAGFKLWPAGGIRRGYGRLYSALDLFILARNRGLNEPQLITRYSFSALVRDCSS